MLPVNCGSKHTRSVGPGSFLSSTCVAAARGTHDVTSLSRSFALGVGQVSEAAMVWIRPENRGAVMNQFPTKTSQGWLGFLGSVTSTAPLSTNMYLPSFPPLRIGPCRAPWHMELTPSAFFSGLTTGQLAYDAICDRLFRHSRRGPCRRIAQWDWRGIGCGHIAMRVRRLAA